MPMRREQKSVAWPHHQSRGVGMSPDETDDACHRHRRPSEGRWPGSQLTDPFHVHSQVRRRSFAERE